MKELKKQNKTLIVHVYQRINLAGKKKGNNPLINCIERSLNWLEPLKTQVYSGLSQLLIYLMGLSMKSQTD